MKQLEMVQMEDLQGGTLDHRGRFVTGLMCGAAVALLFSGVFAPLAAAPAVGCAVGIYGDTI